MLHVFLINLSLKILPRSFNLINHDLMTWYHVNVLKIRTGLEGI